MAIDWGSMTRDPTPCPDCGAALGDRAGCDAAFLELGARAAADVRFAYRRRAIVDAYCLQHPAYIQSIKSFAAHVCGLCAAVERPDDPRATRAVWSALQVPPDAVKPALPTSRAARTVAGVYGAETAEAFHAEADAWIAAVWAAWREHHALARRWLDYSIAKGGRR
jgi:Family of unknown function (DUF5946)